MAPSPWSPALPTITKLRPHQPLSGPNAGWQTDLILPKGRIINYSLESSTSIPQNSSCPVLVLMASLWSKEPYSQVSSISLGCGAQGRGASIPAG